MGTLADRISELATRIASEFKNAVRPRLLPVGGAAGTFLTKNTPTDFDVSWALPGLRLIGGGPTIITATGSFSKDPTARLILFQLIGAGGPGGSGARGDTLMAHSGGGAGAGGQVTERWFPAHLVPDSVACTVPDGPAGGAARTIDNSIGASGTAAATTRVAFTGLNLTMRASAGAAGQAGALTAISSGGQGVTTMNLTQYPNASGGNGGFGTDGAASSTQGVTGPGGGGGGGGNTTSASTNGGNGVVSAVQNYGATGTILANGATSAGASGTNGGSPSTPLGFGSGGGGGASNISGAGGAGGNGGLPGGGGGGGGSSLNGNNSGAGGAGGRGEIRVWQYA